MSYANSGGGTLTLPSPTHVHHVDVTSAVRSLRRSLSRSPSKFRLITKSPSSSPKSPLSPSPKRSLSQPATIFTGTPHTPSPLAVPFPPSAKLALRSSTRTKTAPPRQSSRTRSSPKSPMKRALSQASDSGNALPTSTVSVGGQENSGNQSPIERRSFERASRMVFNVDTSAPVNHALSRLSDGSSDCNPTSSTSSPLKRSDAIMNLDQASLGSPVAKRRSLHGSATFGHDFNVFDHGPGASAHFEIHDDSTHEYELSTAPFTAETTTSFTSMPKRSSSLRKSTLQQRHGEKTSWGRRHAAQMLAAQQSTNFSKSLPAGSLRPFSIETGEEAPGSFSTPQNYKSVKPLPAAFMSTGLISKVNRNPEEQPTVHGASKGVPDTPCKKNINIFATYPAPVPGSAIAKARHIRHSFGTPSTPFNPHGNQNTPGVFGKSTGVFGNVFGNRGLTRRGSFLSVDGDEGGGSPDAKGDSQTSTDFELPPTPTKQALMPGSVYKNGSPSSLRYGSASTPAIGYAPTKKLPRTSSKLNLSTSPGDGDAEDSDTSMDLNDSPTMGIFRLSSYPARSVPSFARSRALRSSNLHSPTPLIPKSLTTSILSPSQKPGFAKFSHVAPASPLERIDFIERLSPRTPQDSMLPPDPSGLSISNSRDGQAAKPGGSSSVSVPPPATPTTGRDSFPQIGNKRISTTPISSFAPTEIHEALTSRFEKVEMIGTGEFSQVYRVTQVVPRALSFFNASSSPTENKSPPAPMPERVFAVKMSRQPYQGTRDRQRKLQEVSVLKALGHSDHVIHLIDSWEEKNYLYIQTEFCEEGSLDLFLSQVGRKGRLDDFRIWKIMLELSKGLKHIHDSGFIHLDLKPANVLITFEGVLKIGDFGMATTWPAQAGIEGEGDREYIGPEILLGQYDKPADVFALGLIMLEIAGNVQLPDNGPTWQRLRSGDMTDVPSLTWSSASTIPRDATGVPLDESEISLDPFESDDEIRTDFGSPTLSQQRRHGGPSSKSLSHDPGNLFGSMRRGELHKAPAFMQDMYHDHALDRIVRWMILPTPQDRPLIHQVLESDGIRWVEARRRAGATVFEGNWGPADDILADDAEMMDV
ncbi:hypothetical protein B7494_g2293 [Chlorociboria aeruginascens]|nr:hypothetical protein B7494_g2293 [Chlorociboria aeruginascens]